MSAVNFAELRERAEMWVNFFHGCELGTVVQDSCATVWQKRGADTWQRVGCKDTYRGDDIQWPVSVLRTAAD